MRRLLFAFGIASVLALALSPLGHAEGDAIEVNGYLVKLRPVQDNLKPDDVVAEAVEEVLGKDWTPSATELRLEYRITPRDAAVTPRATFADAWSVVHRLQASRRFERAEPLLPVQVQAPAAVPTAPAPKWSSKCTPQLDVKGGDDDDEGDEALNDSKWSLGSHGARVTDAWALGAYGEGIVIAHPDTGYLNHPSINTALLGRGFNFSDGLSIALDTADEGRLQWRGHGTRTSSVIAGRLFKIENLEISGVAPNAQIMPLKVAHRVILIDKIDYDMNNVARAIRAAAIGDPNFVRRPAHVISMSLGGAPSKAVEEALKLAEENNLIVLAAAGNDVPTRQVAWPARYRNVIAIAGSNYRESNWKGSSKGGAIAVAAPGQNVWTAKVRRVDGKMHFCIESSSGTSYAVATTAGVAALWLSHHRETLKDRPALDLARTFKAFAMCTARPINVDKKEQQKYGGGIIDAGKLLAEPLPDQDGRYLGQSEKCRDAINQLPARLRSGLDRCSNLTALTALLEDERTGEALLFGNRVPGDACARAGHLGDEVASLFAREDAITAAVGAFLDDRSDAALVRLRRAVLRQSISPQLRRHLVAADSCAADRSCT